MTMEALTRRLGELIRLIARGQGSDHDIAELQLLQRLRVKMLSPPNTEHR